MPRETLSGAKRRGKSVKPSGARSQDPRYATCIVSKRRLQRMQEALISQRFYSRLQGEKGRHKIIVAEREDFQKNPFVDCAGIQVDKEEGERKGP